MLARTRRRRWNGRALTPGPALEPALAPAVAGGAGGFGGEASGAPRRLKLPPEGRGRGVPLLPGPGGGELLRLGPSAAAGVAAPHW